ncbi:MAG: hypothetical protein AAF391_08660, partial [Bacteroidota bacterium]
GYSLTGNHDQAIATLNSYILMDAEQDFTKDSDFESLVQIEQFKEIQNQQNNLTTEMPVKQVYDWSIQGSHPESITYSDKMRSFLLGGIRDGKIWMIKEGKKPEVFAETSKNSWAVMGLDVSPDGRCLWVCTSSMTNFEGYNQNEQGFASVLKYDLKNGKLLDSQTVSGGHNFGDLIIDKKGNIYVSDGVANKLYWVNNKNEKLEVFADLSEQVFNLQGLTFNQDESAIYLSDYIDGIYKLDLKSKQLKKLSITSDNILLKGIDGLYFKENSLIGLHNGTKPNRVVRYTLSTDGNSITSKETISQAGVLGEPTQGVFVDETFFYISNSPWAAYDADGNFSPQQESTIIGQSN